MYIIMVYSLRVKKQAQFILKIATVQEILQKNKREIALVNLSVRRVSAHLKLVLPPLYAPFSRSLAAENPDMQYAFGAFLLEVRRALETASFFPGRQKKALPAKRFFNKRNPLLWICKIPFGRRLIDLISLSAQTENFILQRGSVAFAARSIFCQNRKRTILSLQ